MQRTINGSNGPVFGPKHLNFSTPDFARPAIGTTPVDVFHSVLERELDGKLASLDCVSVDEVLQRYSHLR